MQTTPEEDAEAKKLFAGVDGVDPSKEVQEEQSKALTEPGIAQIGRAHV